MILRDSLGEIEAGLGDLFQHKGCTLEIVCPDSESSTPGRLILCVRLVKGVLEDQGRRWENVEGKNGLLFLFEADLVATCLRNQAKTQPARETISHPPEWDALESASLDRPEKATGSGKKNKARPVQDQPNTQESLF